jgi:hypothetical protein
MILHPQGSQAGVNAALNAVKIVRLARHRDLE